MREFHCFPLHLVTKVPEPVTPLARSKVCVKLHAFEVERDIPIIAILDRTDQRMSLSLRSLADHAKFRLSVGLTSLAQIFFVSPNNLKNIMRYNTNTLPQMPR